MDERDLTHEFGLDSAQERVVVRKNPAAQVVMRDRVLPDVGVGDTVLALKRDRELWLLPTRGAAAGGLVLKQRNLDGDRAVLVREVLEDAPVIGARPAMWDERQGALRVALIEVA